MAFHEALADAATDTGSAVYGAGATVGASALDVPADAVNVWTSDYTEEAPEETGWIGAASDLAVGGSADVSGIREWQQTDTAQDLREDVNEGGFLSRLGAGAAGLTDVVLDNPNASVQEGAQDAIVGAYELGAGREATDEEVAQEFSSAYSGLSGAIEGAVEGTAADNPVTDAVSWGGQAIIADPAEAVFGGLTGVDVETGSTEATVGAADLFDVGVGAATLGTGTLAARGADEGAGIVSRLFGGSDEAAGTVDDVAGASDESPQLVTDGGQDIGEDSGSSLSDLFSGGDDVASRETRILSEGSGASDEAAEQAAEQTSRPLDSIFNPSDADDSGGLFSSIFGGSDEAAGAVDDAAQATDDDVAQAVAGVGDDAGQAADESSAFFSRIRGASDDAAGAADEGAQATDDDVAQAVAGVGDEGAQAADDSGGLFSRIFGGSDEAAGAVDDVASASDEGGSRLGNLFFGSRRRTAGTLLGTGLLGGAAATALDPSDAPDEFTTAEGLQFQSVRELDPVEQFPNGGVIYNVQRDLQTAGYWVLLGLQGRNLVLLDESRDTRTAQISAEDFQGRVAGANQSQGGSQ